MTAAMKLPGRMTVAEFLAWDSQDGRLWQLVDGEPQAMAPASRTHGAIQSELARLIGNHLAEQNSQCSVVTAPGVVPRVRADWNVRIPDLSVTCSDYHTEEAVLGSPVLVIEILSPSNEAETWTNVWAYTSIPSVQEIVVIRTAMIAAELLRCQPDNTWPARAIPIGAEDELVLESIGLRLSLRSVYRTTRLVAG